MKNSTPQPGFGVKLDWLQGTVRFADVKDFREAVEFVVSNFSDTPCWEPDKPRFMGIKWENSGFSAKGIIWGWNLPSLKNRFLGRGFISTPGSVLKGVDHRDIWRTCRGLVHTWKFKPTRVDVALDDYTKSVSFEQVTDALRARNFTGFQKSSATENFDEQWGDLQYIAVVPRVIAWFGTTINMLRVRVR